MRYLTGPQRSLLQKALVRNVHLYGSNSNTVAALFTRGLVEFVRYSDDPFTILKVTPLGQLMLSKSVLDLITLEHKDTLFRIKLTKTEEKSYEPHKVLHQR